MVPELFTRHGRAPRLGLLTDVSWPRRIKLFGQNIVLIACTPVETKLMQCFQDRVDGVLIIDSNAMRNRLEVDVLTNLKGTMVDEAKTGMSRDEITKSAVVSREEHVHKEGISQLDQVVFTVTGTREGMRVVRDRKALSDAHDYIGEALNARGGCNDHEPEREA